MSRNKAGEITIGSRMPPRAGQRDIAQRRCAKRKSILFPPGHAKAPLIARVALKTCRFAWPKLRLTHGMKPKIGQKWPAVTGRASRRAIKQLKPARLRARIAVRAGQ